MTKHYTEIGSVFIVEGKRSSDSGKNTLIAYMYKHHGNLETSFTFDLDEHGQMIEDIGNPIAKINWHNGDIVRVLDKTKYNSLSDEVKRSIGSIFYDYLTKHIGQ